MDHTHCKSCISAHCQQQSQCSVDYCPNGCGFFMHQCKLHEHDRYCCPEAITPCVNAGYGCSELMKRKYILPHIEHCPASTVVCCFSHQRTECVLTKSIELENDLSHALEEKDEPNIDQKFVEGDLEVWRTSRLDVTNSNGKQKVWLPKHLDTIRKEKAGKGLTTSYTDSYMQEYHGVEATGTTASPPNLSLDTNIGVLTNFRWVAKRRFTSQALSFQTRTCVETTLNTKLYHVEKDGEDRKCCSFACNEVVRRDEFADHWKTLHLDIQLDMTHSLVRHCPMYSYGCTYSMLNLTPSPKGSCLDYSKETDCFLYKPPPTEVNPVHEASSEYTTKIQTKQELAMYGYDDEDEEESYDVLGQLPAEVLMTICSFLDSQSLWQLSQVNHYMRKVCLNLVKKNGVVYWEWEQDSPGSWIPGPKIWSFSKVFRGIPSWQYTSEPAIVAHMMSCDYIKANVKPYTSDMVLSMIK